MKEGHFDPSCKRLVQLLGYWNRGLGFVCPFDSSIDDQASRQVLGIRDCLTTSGRGRSGGVLEYNKAKRNINERESMISEVCLPNNAMLIVRYLTSISSTAGVSHSLYPTPNRLYAFSNRWATAFQFTTFQMAEKYSALRFSYCR